MAILKVARMGHPVLRIKTPALERAAIKSAAVQKLIDDMMDTMREYLGVGLAAPQVHEGVRLFVAALDTDDRVEDVADIEPIALINPDTTPVAGTEIGGGWERCPSIRDTLAR